jgi:ankyrin repeat protein
MKSLLILPLLLATTLLVRTAEIHKAAAEGDLPRVTALALTDPAQINMRDRGTTPLHEAARAGHLDVVKFLVERGATLNTNDISGATPLRLALGYHRTNVVEYLRAKGAVDRIAPVVATRTAPSPPSTPAVAVAPPPPIVEPAPIVASPMPAVNSPMSAPAVTNPQVTSLQSKSNLAVVPATNAALSRNVLQVIYPIHEASRVGDAEQIKFLLKSFPDLLEAGDEKGFTPLHIAVASKQFGSAETLLALRAKVNARADNGQTPLHLAARAGDLRMAMLLVTNRADVNARDQFDVTPVLAATFPSERAEFQAEDFITGTPRFTLAQRRAAAETMHQQQFALAQFLVSRGANVNARSRVGATPLLQAVRVRNDALVQLLVRSGAEVNVSESVTGVTPLHIAAGRGMTNIVTHLLSARAAMNAADSRGETPLCFALHEGQPATAALLKSHGATIGNQLPLNTTEQSLVTFYQQSEAALQRASASGKAKLILEMTPTKSDVEKMFPRHAAQAWSVVSELRRQIDATFRTTVQDSQEGKEIWRMRPEPMSPVVQDWRARGWLNPELPVLGLIVDRVGSTSHPGDYCFVNNHWVLLPPLPRIAAQQQAQR